MVEVLFKADWPISKKEYSIERNAGEKSLVHRDVGNFVLPGVARRLATIAC
jgi:hypothetical protein